MAARGFGEGLMKHEALLWARLQDEMMRSGEIDLAKRVSVDPAEIVLGSGVLAYMAGPI